MQKLAGGAGRVFDEMATSRTRWPDLSIPLGGRYGILPAMKGDIAIVGAGLTGMSLGVALAGAGRRVALIDARPAAAPTADVRFDTRIYAISPASARWLEVSRAWSTLDPARISPVYDMHVFGDAARDLTPGLDLSAYREGLGELCTIAEEREMSRVLADAARFAPNLEVIRPVKPVCLVLEANEARIDLTGGESVQAELIVAADGANSWVREAAGIATDCADYHQSAVVANFDCENPHQNCASQWFRVEEDGVSSVLAWLPLPGRRISIVWSVATTRADGLMALAPEAFALRVAGAGMHALGLLSLAGERAVFPLRSQRARSLIAPRLALVGDAAHVLHPLAGQGLNLGFGDCAELFRTLGEARDCGDMARLRAFERARKSALAEMHVVTDGLARLFSAGHPAVRTLRNAGLKLAGRLPVLSGLIVRRAIGG